MRKIFASIAVATLAIAAVVTYPQANAADPDWDLTGNYVVEFQLTGDPTTYAHDMTLTQDGSDNLTGSGGYPAEGTHTYHWNITSGSIHDGNQVDLTAVYDLGATGTIMHLDGTVASNGTISGTWDDNLNGGTRTGTFTTTSGAADNTASSTVVVTANTSAGENQPGWMFNRDTSTDTPFVFNEDQHSIGDGALYVQPIGSTAADKFVGENFLNEPIANVDFISYDFMIGSGSDDTDEEQFYMNVYANFGVSSDTKFYDCRYNVVPTSGSTTDWTTVTFDPNQAYDVTQRGDSPYTCPAIPAQMDNLSAGSNIRAFSISVGDTSTSDVGLSGYLDNVVVNLDNGTTVYDFELDEGDTQAPNTPVISMPACGSTQTSAQLTKIDWNDVTDDSAPVTYYYESSLSSATNPDGSFTSPVYGPVELSASEIATPGTPEGTYYVHVKAVDADDNASAWSTTCVIIVDNTPTPPTPTTQFTVSGGGNISLNGSSPKGKKAFTFDLDVTGNDLGEAEGSFTWVDHTSKKTCTYTTFSNFSSSSNTVTFTASGAGAGCANNVEVTVTDNGKNDSISVGGTNRSLTGGNVVIKHQAL
jgi:hypothetical protein